LTVEILAAEIVQRTPLTAILEDERERWGAQAEALFGSDDFLRRPYLRGITLLLVAGVQYLLVRSRTIRIFGAIDLRSDAGWQALKASVRAMALNLLAAPPPPVGGAAASRAAPGTTRRRGAD
jgi:hypothetical protein